MPSDEIAAQFMRRLYLCVSCAVKLLESNRSGDNPQAKSSFQNKRIDWRRYYAYGDHSDYPPKLIDV